MTRSIFERYIVFESKIMFKYSTNYTTIGKNVCCQMCPSIYRLVVKPESERLFQEIHTPDIQLKLLLTVRCLKLKNYSPKQD